MVFRVGGGTGNRQKRGRLEPGVAENAGTGSLPIADRGLLLGGIIRQIVACQWSLRPLHFSAITDHFSSSPTAGTQAYAQADQAAEGEP
jgi:hypothetical protein